MSAPVDTNLLAAMVGPDVDVVRFLRATDDGQGFRAHIIFYAINIPDGPLDMSKAADALRTGLVEAMKAWLSRVGEEG